MVDQGWEFEWSWRCVQFATAWGKHLIYDDGKAYAVFEILDVTYKESYGEPQVQVDYGLFKPWLGCSATMLNIYQEKGA